MPFDVDVEPPSDPLYLHLWLSQFSRHLCLLANELLACPIEPCPQSLAAARTFIHAAWKWGKCGGHKTTSKSDVLAAWGRISKRFESSHELGQQWSLALRQEIQGPNHEPRKRLGWIVPITMLYQNDRLDIHNWVNRLIALERWRKSFLSSHPELPRDYVLLPDMVRSFDRQYWKTDAVVKCPVEPLSTEWTGATFDPAHHISYTTHQQNLQYSLRHYSKRVSVESGAEDEDDEKDIEDVDRSENDVQVIGEEGSGVELVADNDEERPTVRHRYADNALQFTKKKYNGKDTAWCAAVEMDGVEVVKSNRRCEWCAGVAPEGPKYKLSCRRITNYGNYEVPEDDDGCIQCFLSGRLCVWAWTRNPDGSMPEQEPTSAGDDRGEKSPDSPTSPPCVKPEYKEEDGGARDSKFGRGVATVDVFGVSVPIADCRNPPGTRPSTLDSERARLRERALDLLQQMDWVNVAIAEAAARKGRLATDAWALVDDYVAFMSRDEDSSQDAD